MEYRIRGQIVPVVEMELREGETVYCQKGGMSYMTGNVEMQTRSQGGLLGGLGRMISGESIFTNQYKAKTDNAVIGFASTVPGSIVCLDLHNDEYIAQRGSFLVAEPSVQLEAIMSKNPMSGLFGGEGLILQSITGTGLCFLECDGDAIERELAVGEKLVVNTGNVLAFQSSVKYKIEAVKGLSNVLFGGEGLFNTTLTGPGKVIIQTMNLAGLRQALGVNTSQGRKHSPAVDINLGD